MRQVNLAREESERWRPFSVLALLLVVLGLVVNSTVVLLFMLVGAYAWIVTPQDIPLPAHWRGNGLVEVALAVVRHTVPWLALLVGVLLFVQIAWYVRSPARRMASWRESHFWEYVNDVGSARIGTAGVHDAVVFGSVRSIKAFLSRTGLRVREGFGPERVAHARRWAWAHEAQALATALTGLAGLFLSLALVLWSHGVITAAEEVSAVRALLVLATDYAWHLAEAIPALELPDTLHWERPALFEEDVTWGWMLLVLKVLIFGPIVLYISDVIRVRRSPQPPLPPFGGDAVMQVLFREVMESGMPVMSLVWRRAWVGHYEDCAAWLTENGVAAPGGGRWTANAVGEHVRVAVDRRLAAAQTPSEQ
ncbi:hypothetical protein CLV68_0399 [Actinokineospora cianjurensis]|uniref:Uncharacterized protein n=1 Tax=Actinokineospora cianjurensis TaxID=585224 RepID=A0A421B6S1_9PSEU|nr:hypothetical protein CLV68_0399 [Actinokineospora cianjurensis]